MKSQKGNYILFISIAVLLSSSLFLAASSSSNWNIESIYSSSKVVMGSIMIAVDSHDYPRIAYESRAGDSSQDGINLMYACWDGSVWSKQILINGSGRVFQSQLGDFRLDVSNTAHFVLGTEEGLVYGTLIGSNLSTKVIDSAGGADPKLAFDSLGNPHVAYIGRRTDRNAAILYASSTEPSGSHWNIQVVDSPDIGPYDASISMVIDSSSNAHILYDNTQQTIKYAFVSNDSIKISTLFEGEQGFLAVDSAGKPQFAYQITKRLETGYRYDGIGYAVWNGTAWNTQTIVSNSSSPSLGGMTLDKHDRPQIDYLGVDGNLVFGRWTGDTWEFQTVVLDANGPAALSLDSLGNPHLSYSGPQPDPCCMYATTTLFSQEASQTVLDNPPWVILPIIIVIATAGALIVLKNRKSHN